MNMNDKVLAKVGTVVITENDVNETLAMLSQRGQNLNHPEGRKAIVDQLVNRALFLCEARRNFYEADAKFKQDLARVKDEMLTDFAVEKTLAAVKVTDDDVKKFYEEHKAEFVSGETVEASHILVDSEEKALEILADIKAEKVSFEDAAKQHSSCPSSQRGGALGEFTHGQMVPEFDQAAFAMNVGEVSEPVKTQFGYHLIKLTGKKSNVVVRAYDGHGDMVDLRGCGHARNKAFNVVTPSCEQTRYTGKNAGTVINLDHYKVLCFFSCHGDLLSFFSYRKWGTFRRSP